MIRHAMPTLPLYGSFQVAGASGKGVVIALIARFLHSYRLSGSSGCFKSHNGRRLATVGVTAKLYAGGGELTDHSRVHASQGSFPALAPLKEEIMGLPTKISVAMP